MSRVIKFRALELDTGVMRFGSYIAEDGVSGIDGSSVTRHKIFDGLYHEFAEDTLGQFTGLKDEDGVDIYEGDIVESDYYWPDFRELAVIGYDDTEMKFCFNSKTGDIKGEQDAFRYGHLKVIGNIHQNPELLSD